MPVDRERPRRERGELRRRLLLDSAIEVIAEKGIGGATHRAIAAHAGVPASSTTYFFASIEELISEALSAAMLQETERMAGLQERMLADRLTTDEIVDALVDLVLSQSRSTATAQFEVYLFAGRDPALRSRAEATIAATRRTAEVGLRAWGIRDAARAGAAVTAMIDGFALHRMARPGAGGADELRLALRAMLAGFRALQDDEGMTAE